MRRRRGSTGLFALGGWLFADLLLAMAVLFLAMSSTGTESADVARTIDPTPINTPTTAALPTLPTVTPRPVATQTPRPQPMIGSPRYGITADPANVRQAQEVRNAGAGLTLLAVAWREVEPEPAEPADFRWATYDATFESAHQAGLQPLVIVTANPQWSWVEGSSGIIRPEHYSEFAEFVEALVARYSRYTRYWSFYNEPDCNGPVTAKIHASCWGDHGAAYAQMLKAVYPAVKRADANAYVIFGGIAFDNFQSEKAYSRQFLDDALAAGAGDAFDVFNFHYYTGFRQVWEAYGRDVIGKTTFLRSVLQRHGLEKPFILSEIGTGSQAAGESEELQARYVAQAYARALAAGIQTIVWYDLLDTGPSGFGLMKGNFQPRPSYRAYQTFVDIIGDHSFRRTLGGEELGTSNVEGYEFRTGNDRRVLILWSRDDLSHSIRFPGTQAEIISLLGETLPVPSNDGYLSITVGPQPVYVRFP